MAIICSANFFGWRSYCLPSACRLRSLQPRGQIVDSVKRFDQTVKHDSDTQACHCFAQHMHYSLSHGIVSHLVLQDRRRIKQQGPAEIDLIEQYTAETEDGEGETTMEEHQYIPPEVLGTSHYDTEPEWESMPQMPYMEFYHGLRQRNWTSSYHDATAEPWNLKFFRDSGRLLRPVWRGFRVEITKPDGSRCWVDLPDAGSETFVKDHMQPMHTIPGDQAQLDQLRVPQENVTLYQYGYNQVFQQLFQAYEQQLPKAAKRVFEKQGLVNMSKYKYSCPGEAVGVSFHLTPQEPSLQKLWTAVPSLLFFSFAFSFLAVCLGLGIFKWVHASVTSLCCSSSHCMFLPPCILLVCPKLAPFGTALCLAVCLHH